jgi:long-chain fatty acid transport protein
VLGDDQPEYEVSNPTSLPFDVEWEDQIVFKIGAQLAASDTFRIRLGYDYGKQPLNEDKAIQNIAFPAIAEHHVTAGLGWNATQKLAINLGAVYSPEAKISGTDPGFATTYEVKMSQFSLDAGISYVF